jgi:hypothetical protein
MNSRVEGQWRWLWLSPLLVLALAFWCSLHGRALGEAAVGMAIALPWAIKSAIGWTAAGMLLGAFGHRVFAAPLSCRRIWTLRALTVLAVFTVTLGSETWLLSGDVRVAEWLYNRAPLHVTFATLLVGGYLMLRARHEACANAMAGASAQVTGPAPVAAAAPPAAEPVLVEVMTGTGRTRVRLDEIECLVADRNYVNVHTPQRSYLLRQTLSSLEQSLRTRDFLRIHRSTIVNRAMIRERRGGGVLVLRSGRMVRISRAFARQLN